MGQDTSAKSVRLREKKTENLYDATDGSLTFVDGALIKTNSDQVLIAWTQSSPGLESQTPTVRRIVNRQVHTWAGLQRLFTTAVRVLFNNQPDRFSDGLEEALTDLSVEDRKLALERLSALVVRLSPDSERGESDGH